MPQHLNPEQTSLPILILVLDEQAGFRGAAGGPTDVVKASRAIFTDINKYAVKVSAEREYLLDDLSLTAVAMRELLTPGIGRTSQESLNTDPKIPLALVDWTGARQVKFEDGPFISSVQAMHTIVAGLLGSDVSAEPESTNYLSQQGWVETIDARLDINDPEWDKDDILARILSAESEAMPFRLSSGEVKAAGRAFARGVGQICVQLLLRGGPYRELIDGYLGAGLLGAEEEYWLGQGENARLGWQAQFGRDPEPEARAIYENVKRQFYYAYLVVFQRGFVLSGSGLVTAADQVLELWEVEGEPSQKLFIDAWIDRFNLVLGPLLSPDHEDFWLGSAIRADRRIDYGARGLNSVAGPEPAALAPLPRDAAGGGRRSKAPGGGAKR